MSVAHTSRNLLQQLRSFLWKRDTDWRELVIIAAAIIFVIALIMVVR